LFVEVRVKLNLWFRLGLWLVLGCYSPLQESKGGFVYFFLLGHAQVRGHGLRQFEHAVVRSMPLGLCEGHTAVVSCLLDAGMHELLRGGLIGLVILMLIDILLLLGE